MIWKAIKYRFYERWILGNSTKIYSRKCHGFNGADDRICEQYKQCRYISRLLYRN